MVVRLIIDAVTLQMTSVDTIAALNSDINAAKLECCEPARIEEVLKRDWCALVNIQ